MVRTASPSTSKPAWHDTFLKMAPAIKTHAKIAFRHLDREAREEAVQEVVCNACCLCLNMAGFNTVTCRRRSEERTRQALRIIDAMAPCVAMIDEVEKAFAGLNGNGDSGVSSRMFGTFLSWLNDHESDVFVVCTANDVSKLPPEFGRSERFDGVFFLDLPSREEKDVIWNIYLDLFEISRDERLPDDQNLTGAEVKACCRLSALLDVPLVQAAQNVVPVAVTAAESVERLRTWASGRCLSASQPGIYGNDEAKPKRRRKIKTDPLAN